MADNDDDIQQTANGIETTKPSARPALTLHGSGGIQIAVWKNKSENGIENYSIRMERTYKDADGEFQTTPYLRETDLLRTQKLLSAADDWIEQDRAKYRAAKNQGAER